MNRLAINSTVAAIVAVLIVGLAYVGTVDANLSKGQLKQITKTCIEAGGEMVGEVCTGVTPIVSECTVATQAVDCPSGSNSATGPGICIVDSDGIGQCDYLYMQSCKRDAECDAFLGVDESPYICCTYHNVNRCMNPFLCR